MKKELDQELDDTSMDVLRIRRSIISVSVRLRPTGYLAKPIICWF